LNGPVRIPSRRWGWLAGTVTGTVMAAHVSGKPADRSSERARGRSTPGGPPCLSPDRLCAHGEGRRDELERLRAAPKGLSSGRLLVGSASYVDLWTYREITMSSVVLTSVTSMASDSAMQRENICLYIYISISINRSCFFTISSGVLTSVKGLTLNPLTLVLLSG